MSRPASLPKLEQDAYYAVLRALAVNELDWTKEKLLTDLRKVLNITNDQHFQFLEEVMEDKLVLRLQDSRAGGTGAAAAPAAAPPPIAVPPAYDMPPPPRQAGTPAAMQRKHSRPASAAGKAQNAITPPLGPRASRLSEPAMSGDARRRHVKRERDEGFDPKRPGSGMLKSKAGQARVRNRSGSHRRASGVLPQPPAPLLPAITYMQAAKRFKALPFAAEFLAERIAHGDVGELEEMHSALQLRDAALGAHLELLLQLEDDTLVTRDPARYCQLLINELEATEAHLSTEIDGLRSEDELGL